MIKKIAVFVACGLLMTHAAFAQEAADLAKQLSNPIASLISVPVEFDYDQDYGPADEGSRLSLTVKPVIPITLNANWNVISRTIVPLVTQDDIFPGAGDQSGLGDIVQSLFFSPAAPTARGLIWGVGPVFLLPTATDDLLGGEKWGAGPTVIALRQGGPWTYGFLANHIWDFAGEDDRGDINNTFLQPFLSYNTPTAWTFGVNTESTYSWESEEWTVPLNASVSKLAKLGKLPVQYKAGVRYWADTPESGPEGFGFKLGIVFLLPK